MLADRVGPRTCAPHTLEAESHLQMAERVGFEPTVHETCTPVFETGTLNHSDTSPRRKARRKFTAMQTIVKKAVNRGAGAEEERVGWGAGKGVASRKRLL